jgi:hypothetical protein
VAPGNTEKRKDAVKSSGPAMLAYYRTHLYPARLQASMTQKAVRKKKKALHSSPTLTPSHTLILADTRHSEEV